MACLWMRRERGKEQDVDDDERERGVQRVGEEVREEGVEPREVGVQLQDRLRVRAELVITRANSLHVVNEVQEICADVQKKLVHLDLRQVFYASALCPCLTVRDRLLLRRHLRLVQLLQHAHRRLQQAQTQHRLHAILRHRSIVQDSRQLTVMPTGEAYIEMEFGNDHGTLQYSLDETQDLHFRDDVGVVGDAVLHVVIGGLG